jgi:mannose-6-phosphate isomerase-like protein (cupin superfamily)
MENDGFSVYEWSDSPGATYSTHMHDNDQSHWIVSGTLELDVAGYGIVQLSPGDRDFMPAGTDHAARVIGDEPVVYLIGSK